MRAINICSHRRFRGAVKNMLNLNFVLPFALGLVIVLQGGLNRLIARDWSLGSATALNATVLFIFACTVCTLPGPLKARFDWGVWRWWYLIPGILGFCFVAGAPLAISRLGAVRMTIGLIAAQLIGGLLWDWYMEGLSITWPRLAGVALAFVGVVISSL